jgi:uncharacterized protein (DUF58 family)
MVAVTVKTVAKAYFITVLLLAILVSPLPQLGIALVLLVIQLASTYRPPRAGLDFALIVGSLVFAPLAFSALVGGLFSVLLMIPALFLLDQNLKDNASAQFSVFAKPGRSATGVLKTVATVLLFVFAASVIVWNITLMLTAAVLTVYFVVVLGDVFRKVPKMPFEESKTWCRTIVGDSSTNLAHIKTKSGMTLFASVSSAASWVHVAPSEFVLSAQGEAAVDLRFVPPLAGPSKLRLQASALDVRGLVQIDQILEPVDLHIIPRAKYATWLAKKYLERSASGLGMAASVAVDRSNKAARRGVEYHGSRQYQPGDRWRDIDWKHTFLLGELIVKEFAVSQGQTAILVADLTAKDAEEADKLAYDFVMSALTFAMESMPTALAVYNQAEVFAAIAPMNPREALKKTLQLTEKIRIVEPSEKVLQSEKMRGLRRSIGQLEGVKSDSTQKLIDVLKLEYDANQEAAINHPAGIALSKIIEGTPPPAILTVISSLSINDDALSITLDRLKEKGYSILQVELK